MALDAIIDSNQLNKEIKSVADTIRAKTGRNEEMEWPEGLNKNINSITGNGAQPDWLENDEYSPSYIRNKPDAATKEDLQNIIGGAPEAFDTLKEVSDWINENNKQVNWDQNDETAVDYIKNRPFYEKVESVALTYCTFVALADNKFNYITPLGHNDLMISDIYNNNRIIELNGQKGTITLSSQDMWTCHITGLFSGAWDSRFGNSSTFTSSVPLTEGETYTITSKKDNVVIEKLPLKYSPNKGIDGEGKDSEIFNDYVNNKASGDNSHAEGCYTEASGHTSHAEGDHTTASGLDSHAEGNSTVASGGSSHAEGNSTIASGQDSHAEGFITEAAGDFGSHAEGYHTGASGNSSHAEGSRTIAFGDSSHAEGSAPIQKSPKTLNIIESSLGGVGEYQYSQIKIQATKANCIIDFGEGKVLGIKIGDSELKSSSIFKYNNKIYNIFSLESLTNDVYAEFQTILIKIIEKEIIPTGAIQISIIEQGSFGSSSHAEGEDTISASQASHAEGLACKVLYHSEQDSSIGAHAEGTNSIAKGQSSHAEGNETQAIGMYGSHAEGQKTKATGMYGSHAEGQETQAFGSCSHAEGQETQALGTGSHAEGSRTTAIRNYQHVEGVGNKLDEEDRYLHIAGNAIHCYYSRSNAYTLDWDGNGWYQGSVSVSGNDMDTPRAALTPTAIIISSSTPQSSKQFKITVDDTGAIKAEEIIKQQQ